MNGVTRIAVLACAVLLTGTAPRQEQSVELRSPDGKTILVAGVLERTSGNCGYALSHDGRTILRPSAFALTFRDEPAFGEHLRVAAVTRSRAAGQWNPVYGERRVVPDSYNQVVLSLSETRPPHRAVEMTFRAYNEGVAFQYVVQPSEGRRESVLLEEHSRFVVRAGLSGLGRVRPRRDGTRDSPSRRWATIANGRWWWRWAPACTSPSARRSSSISRA